MTATQTATRTPTAPLTLTVAGATTPDPGAAKAERVIDEALLETFPASDPPSWWAGGERPNSASLR